MSPNRFKWAQIVVDELGVSPRLLAIHWALFPVQMVYISSVVRSPLWFLRLENCTDGSNHLLLAPWWPEIYCWVLDLVLLAFWCSQSFFSVVNIVYMEWYLELWKQHLIFQLSYSAVWKDSDKFYLPPTPLSLLHNCVLCESSPFSVGRRKRNGAEMGLAVCKKTLPSQSVTTVVFRK